jgi:hypothetical protein
MKEELLKLKNEFIEKTTEILMNGIRSGSIKVKGDCNGLQVLTVELFDLDNNFLMSIWVANTDDDLSNLHIYGFEPTFVGKDNRKEIYKYIEQQVNK